MKRAVWYAGSDTKQRLNEVDTTYTGAIRFLKNYNNVSHTENGAAGYRTTTNALVDLNFKVASLRMRSEEDITEAYTRAFWESPKYAVKWLFFLRDISEGMGERRSFRICLKYLGVSHPEIARAVLEYVPEYGRYDDLLVLLDTPLAKEVAALYQSRLRLDLAAMEAGKGISLLAKWLPGNNTSSAETRRYAEILRRYFQMSPKQYRQTLSSLRRYGKIVETQISASEWSSVNYDRVPAKANAKYDPAFARHDHARRMEYLEKVVAGDKKLHTGGMMPYEIVHRYTGKGYYGGPIREDLLTELLWRKMTEDGFQNEWGLKDAIVVADGSGSMYTAVSGNSTVQAVEVCNSLAIYFAEQLKGVFHNKAITFSGRPQFIDLKDNTSLKDKLEIIRAYCEVSNTNIKAVFDLLLEMAVSHAVPAEELPGQVLIISDMEFDQASVPDYWSSSGDGEADWAPVNEALFTTIRKQYEAAGYRMPRLIFWNVCGRSDTIPMVDNAEGLCLLSGFSQNAMKIAAQKEKKDPWEALKKVLDASRYQPIEEMWRQMNPESMTGGLKNNC